MLMQVIQTQGAPECAEEGTMHVQTVQENFEWYTKREIIQAKEARKAQAMIRNPSKKDFKGLVSNHLVSNFLIMYADITNARGSRNTRFAWAGGTFFPVVLYVVSVFGLKKFFWRSF